MTKRSLGYLCLAFICLVWGTTYLFGHIAMLSFPALLFAGVRNIIAGLLLLGILRFTAVEFAWTRKNLLINFIAGTLIVCLGNGLVTWSVKFIPSGLASLICTLIPLNIVVINLLSGKGSRLNLPISTGILSGLLGMGFIFRDNLKDLGNPAYAFGLTIAFLAALSWSLGTVYSRNKAGGSSPFYNAALQLLFGGISSIVVSCFTGDWHHIGAVSGQGWFALAYLTLIGSTAAFLAYQYALSVLPVGLVATYAYINPLIAVLLGYFVLNEKLTLYTVLAFALTIVGVYLVNLGYKQPLTPRIHEPADR